MERIANYVVENKLNLGISYDGDGDRCLFVTETGEIVDGDIILSIFAEYLKDQGKLSKDTIVATVMSNLGLRKFTKEKGYQLKQTKVGDRYVLEEMLRNGYQLGGEQSGHIILLEYNPTGDGILTSVLLSLILLKNNCSLSELKRNISIYPQALINAKVKNDKKYQYEENEEIKNAIQAIEEEFKENGRVLIRASGTESLVRVMIEGEDQNYISKKAKELASLIEEKLN